ncbi:unnamed protein product [Prorocentrum cordatum]|uniref:P-type phospholipid transporter n=1 Tax=Prorocentrum cordatum TaxID=2364126 RepID=A0ABN9R6W2_9DINO|nr:unnamed protein product [Polarella glacialis]
MLTGEPMPVQRFAVDEGDKHHALEATGALKRSFLYAGTSVLQSSSGQAQDPGMPGRAIGIAVGTGARTAKGSLVRMVLFPAPATFQFTEQLAKVYVIMVVFTCTLFCILMLKDQGHWIVGVFTGLCVLTQSLQPNMPVSFTLAHSVSSARLRADCGVACLSPPRIPIAGKVHVMVLDKTGTITKDSPLRSCPSRPPLSLCGLLPRCPSCACCPLPYARRLQLLLAPA